MKIGKILLGSSIIWLFHMALGWLTCGWLFNWVYQLEPTALWRNWETISTTRHILLMVISFFVAIIFTAVYSFIMKGLPSKGYKKGIIFGIIVWLVGALSGIAPMPIYMNIALIVPVYWIINAFVGCIISGAIIGAIIKE